MLRFTTQTGARSREREAHGMHRIVSAPLFLALSAVLGCAAVLTPITPGADVSVKSDEGLVLGRIHLTGNGTKPHSSPERVLHAPLDIQWRIQEETPGKELLLDNLPSDEPFVLKLPTRSYRLTALSFDTAGGIGQASLPATVDVNPRACTYLGTWQLRMRAGFFDGSIIRQVVDQPSLAENDPKTFVHDELSPPMVMQLSLAMESPLVLTFRTQGAELTSPS